MTPFVRIERNATMSMEQRLLFLQQPDEFFRPFFEGRTPSLDEKLRHVEQLVQRMTFLHTYENNLYHVACSTEHPFIHLMIQRRDGAACKNWRHLQQIKNELIGSEHEAVELFPAESRLVDTMNEYHLWVHATPGYRFPLGFGQRFVFDAPARFDQPIGSLDTAV